MAARRFLYVIAGLIMLTLAAALAYRLFGEQIIRAALIPSVPFDQSPQAAAPDYARPESWLSRPDLAKDPSRWAPKGYGATAQPSVAVFYLSPTTFFRRDRWNAPLDDAQANYYLHLFAQSQASAFNGTGAIWAPRYRQATFGAFLTGEADAHRALDFAYRDVSAAFDAFLAAIPPDRPIVLVGHSQGALLLTRLLGERIAGRPLARRIVAAYVVGWPISTVTDLPALGLPGCTAAGEAGCIIAWQSYAEPADPHMVQSLYDDSTGLDGRKRRGTPMLCVNPLTGTAGGAAPASANRGALVPTTDLDDATIIPGRVPARCDRAGFLLIGPPPAGFGRYVLPGNNYHVYDMALFWANLRDDVAARTATFLKR
jgi:hypothetical protein